MLTPLTLSNLCGPLGLVVENEKLARLQRQLGVSSALIVAEFDLVSTIQDLHDGPDLPAYQTVLRQIRQKGDDIQ